MRKAKETDIDYIAGCYVNTSLFLKSQASDIYIDGLPDIVDDTTIRLAASFIDNDDCIAYIVEEQQEPIACITAAIENTSFNPSGVGKVGHIALCWVAAEHRNQSLGKTLVNAVEQWFRNRDIHVIELSYLAQNSQAEMAWSSLGYVPFRVHAHKLLDGVSGPDKQG